MLRSKRSSSDAISSSSAVTQRSHTGTPVTGVRLCSRCLSGREAPPPSAEPSVPVSDGVGEQMERGRRISLCAAGAMSLVFQPAPLGGRPHAGRHSVMSTQCFGIRLHQQFSVGAAAPQRHRQLRERFGLVGHQAAHLSGRAGWARRRAVGRARPATSGAVCRADCAGVGIHHAAMRPFLVHKPGEEA
jgi:hypothetical protein